MAVDAHESAHPVLKDARDETAFTRLREIFARGDVDLQVTTTAGDVILLPASLRHVLRQAVNVLEREEAVTLEAVREVSTTQAAVLLRVSIGHVNKLLDEGAIPFRRAGANRCISAHDLYVYKEQRHQLSRQHLKEMTRIAEESAGGYD